MFDKQQGGAIRLRRRENFAPSLEEISVGSIWKFPRVAWRYYSNMWGTAFSHIQNSWEIPREYLCAIALCFSPDAPTRPCIEWIRTRLAELNAKVPHSPRRDTVGIKIDMEQRAGALPVGRGVVVGHALHIYTIFCVILGFVNVPKVYSLVYQGPLVYQPLLFLIDRIDGVVGSGLRS